MRTMGTMCFLSGTYFFLIFCLPHPLHSYLAPLYKEYFKGLQENRIVSKKHTLKQGEDYDNSTVPVAMIGYHQGKDVSAVGNVFR